MSNLTNLQRLEIRDSKYHLISLILNVLLFLNQFNVVCNTKLGKIFWEQAESRLHSS